jgi:hypothetical protein
MYVTKIRYGQIVYVGKLYNEHPIRGVLVLCSYYYVL